MDVSKYAVGPDSYDVLSRAQISKFFTANAPCTRDQCDELAGKLLGGPASATPMQGGSSYTVEREEAPKVVQFRDLPIDMNRFELVQQIYREFVPQCVYHGTLGSLHVYIWNRISGPAFCRVRREMFKTDAPGMEQRLRQTIQDFARFFALGWINRPTSESLPVGLQEEYVATLDKLSSTLPENLQPVINEVRQDLHLLFRPDFPIALQHADLLENNIHVEEATGHITGVVDWAEAFIAPFGISLGGAEILLGIQTYTDWHFHPSHVDMRQLFWDTFYNEIGEVSELDRRSIEVARLMGLLERNGFEENGNSGVYLERLIFLNKK
ncbi:uncharacterized protein GGS22DRAFT_196900 [Annulohypoxylon maeteangense]|uniref:uncharacterized protein n=1 Tax=Annulohypoxylon maeteangense TaxID=1927788 RepID=UPI002008D75A|nr:uncharacterized protein GGS22DRAFT_196900 [Annulohypoxylon maeteangense]KAI0889306.1 hypothetical protein GGS22DRAFT_196900 [Annulohypoxylon maeteangense]